MTTKAPAVAMALFARPPEAAVRWACADCGTVRWDTAHQARIRKTDLCRVCHCAALGKARLGIRQAWVR